MESDPIDFIDFNPIDFNKVKFFIRLDIQVVDCLKQADVAREKIAALVGHEDESEIFGRYGKDFNVKVMKDVVKFFEFRDYIKN